MELCGKFGGEKKKQVYQICLSYTMTSEITDNPWEDGECLRSETKKPNKFQYKFGSEQAEYVGGIIDTINDQQSTLSVDKLQSS